MVQSMLSVGGLFNAQSFCSAYCLRVQERMRQEMMEANRKQLAAKEARATEHAAAAARERSALLAKFAEDDRLEQLSAQKRRAKQLEHRREVWHCIVVCVMPVPMAAERWLIRQGELAESACAAPTFGVQERVWMFAKSIVSGAGRPAACREAGTL